MQHLFIRSDIAKSISEPSSFDLKEGRKKFQIAQIHSYPVLGLSERQKLLVTCRERPVKSFGTPGLRAAGYCRSFPLSQPSASETLWQDDTKTKLCVGHFSSL